MCIVDCAGRGNRLAWSLELSQQVSVCFSVVSALGPGETKSRVVYGPPSLRLRRRMCGAGFAPPGVFALSLGLCPWSGLCPIEAAVANRSDLYPLPVAHSPMDNFAIFEHWSTDSRWLVPPTRRALDSDEPFRIRSTSGVVDGLLVSACK